VQTCLKKKSNRKSAIVAIQGRKNSFRKKNAKLSHVGKEPKLHGGSMLRCLFGWDSKLLFWEALWVGEDSMEASFFGGRAISHAVLVMDSMGVLTRLCEFKFCAPFPNFFRFGNFAQVSFRKYKRHNLKQPWPLTVEQL